MGLRYNSREEIVDDAVHACLENGLESGKSYDQICEYYRSNYSNYLFQGWENDIGSSIQRNPNIKQNQHTKNFYLTADAFVTISLTREQLDQLRNGESSLVLLPQEG